MSWDIFVQDIPKGVKSTEKIPDDFAPKSIGSRTGLIKKIGSVVPGADFSEPSLGVIEGPDYSIEVSLGEEDVQSFAFHVHGGKFAAFVVADILERLELRAFDPDSESGIFSIDAYDSSDRKKWQAYRDRVLRGKK